MRNPDPRVARILAAHEDLWRVDDQFIQYPEQKLRKHSAPLIETTIEQWGCQQFETAKPPKAMVEFVERFVRMLRIPSSGYTPVKEICQIALWQIEWNEPYFFLVDTKIQLAQDNSFKHSYLHKASGNVLDPTMIETFQLIRDWDYKPFFEVKNMIEHPGMQAFLNENRIPPGFNDRESAMRKVLSEISLRVWGQFGWVEDFVSDMMNSYEEEQCFDARKGSQNVDSISSAIARDKLFWLSCVFGVMTWFKGPGALQFLTSHHVIYAELLDILDDEAGSIVPVPGTGGEAVVDGTNVFTHKQLELILNRAPDMCIGCGQTVHCTKRISVTALLHPICSCGDFIDPINLNPYDDGWVGHHSSACIEYEKAHPEKAGYVCQRCIFAMVNNLPPDFQCGRTMCPSTKCPHHQGASARLRALTQARTKQLSGSTIQLT